MATATTQLVNGERFQADFAVLQTHILSEFPDVSPHALARTGGDLEEVVALIAHETLHTRALVRRRLAAVAALAEHDDAEALHVHREELEQESHLRRNVIIGVVAGLAGIVVLAVLSIVFAPRMPEPVRAPLLATRRRIPELGGAARDRALDLWEHLPEWGSAARDGAADLWHRRPWA